MANSNIKISQLPNIGSDLNSNTLLPVVDTTGTFVTEKINVGDLANYILTEAGNVLQEAFVSTIAYSVANSSQPNITSVGNLVGLTITNVSNFHIPGGSDGYLLQTDGSGNLSWVPESSNIITSMGPVIINVTDPITPETSFEWSFNIDGSFSLPGNSKLAVSGGSRENIDLIAGENGWVELQSNNSNSYIWVDNNGSYISTNFNVSPKIWSYTIDGNINFPDGSTQSTGWTGTIDTGNVTGLGNISTINLDGDTNNVLHGDGTFSPVSLPINLVEWVEEPISNTSSGSAGQASYDAGGNLFVCVAENTWAKFTGTLDW